MQAVWGYAGSRLWRLKVTLESVIRFSGSVVRRRRDSGIRVARYGRRVSKRYFEDFKVGEVFASGEEYEITPDRLHDYASEFDPQPIHLDAEVANQEMFGGIVASGWHSLSVTMRLVVRSQIFGGAPVVGVGIDRLRFLQPVRAGDQLRAEAEVLEVRASGSNAGRGYIVLRITTRRQDDSPVLAQDWTVLVPRRPPGALVGA